MAEATGFDFRAFPYLPNGLDLLLQMRTFFDGDRTGKDRPGGPTSPPQGLLGARRRVGHILVFTQQREAQNNLQGLSVCGHHNDSRDAPVKGFVASLVLSKAACSFITAERGPVASWRGGHLRGRRPSDFPPPQSWLRFRGLTFP